MVGGEGREGHHQVATGELPHLLFEHLTLGLKGWNGTNLWKRLAWTGAVNALEGLDDVLGTEIPNHDCDHVVRTVKPFVIVPHGAPLDLLDRLFVPKHRLGIRGSRKGDLFEDFIGHRFWVGTVLVHLLDHDLLLFFELFFWKDGVHQHIRLIFDRVFQEFRGSGDEISREILSCKGVEICPVLIKTVPNLLAGLGFGAIKQHVFQEMGHPQCRI